MLDEGYTFLKTVTGVQMQVVLSCGRNLPIFWWRSLSLCQVIFGGGTPRASQVNATELFTR